MKAYRYFIALGVNVMTPNILRYVDTPKYAIELSRGRGIDNQPIYSVTVINKATLESDSKSKLCFTETEAIMYIEELQGE